MSLSNQEANQLKARLNRNRNLSPQSKTSLNNFINKKNAFDRAAFMQQYNAKLRNFRARDASFKRKRVRGNNLNSAMENNTGSVSSGSVNPGKRGRNSPRGVLSAASGASYTSNEESTGNSGPRPMNNNGYSGFNSNNNNGYGGVNSNNENNLERNAKKRRNNSRPQPQPQPQLPLVTAAMGAARAANANARARNIANRKRRITNLLSTLPTGNFKTNATKKISNVISNNTKTTALLTQIKNEKNRLNAANARARANANARARANANKNILKINNIETIRDVINVILSKNQLLEIAKNLNLQVIKSNKVDTLKQKILDKVNSNRNKLIEEINKQLVGDEEAKRITKKVNSFIPSTQNTNRNRPEYTASLVSLYIKDLSRNNREQVIESGLNLQTIMNGISRRSIPPKPIVINKNISTEEFTDLVFIMWLDGVHDKYITKTLDTWFNDTTLFSQKQKSLIQGWNTPLITSIKSLKLPKGGKNILNASLSNFPTGWEKNVKQFLQTKYNNSSIKISPGLPQQLQTSDPQNINIAVDQEYTDSNENSITRFIQGHNSTNKIGVNTLITYGQAFDPGRSMVSGGVHADIELLTRTEGLPKNFLPNNKKYYLCDLNIDLKVGTTSVYKLQVVKDSLHNVVTGFNGKRLFTGISAGQAKQGISDVMAVSKYFGDALQYFYIAAMNDLKRSQSPKTERFFFGSGDSMALLGYDRVCKILKKPVRMVIDFPGSYRPLISVIGMNATIKNLSQPAASFMTGTAEKNNNKSGEVNSKTKRGR